MHIHVYVYDISFSNTSQAQTRNQSESELIYFFRVIIIKCVIVADFTIDVFSNYTVFQIYFLFSSQSYYSFAVLLSG